MNNPRPPINLKTLPSWLLIALVWLISKLPLRLIRLIGAFFGIILWALARQRRFVALTNIRLCFPEMPDSERKKLVFKHCIRFAQAVLDRSLMWFASEKRIRRIVRQHNEERLYSDDGRPTLVLAPHFVGLDAGGVRFNAEYPTVSMYQRQSNPVFDQLMLEGRNRSGTAYLYSRQDGVRKLIKLLRENIPLYYLPDMDFGRKDAIFSPFFGQQAATLTALPKLANLTQALIVPCVTRIDPESMKQGKTRYIMQYYPAWDGYPDSVGDEAQAVRFMNEFIEARISEDPAQYLWMHKRFKTRPEGMAGVY